LEVAAEGTEGLHFTPGDWRQLSDCLLRLWSSPDSSSLMGLAARRKVERSYALQTLAEDHERLYRRLLQR